jgi:hypothetical protein
LPRARVVEELQHPVGPGDRRTRVLEAVQQGQVGEEVLVGVDRPLDLLELHELRLGKPLPLEHLLSKRGEIRVAAEEKLQEQPVARHTGDRIRRLEPFAERALTRRRDPVDELVRPLLLRDGRAPRQPALDQARQDRVDLALCRPPEVADAAACELVELVPRSGAEREQAEHRVLGVGKTAH